MTLQFDRLVSHGIVLVVSRRSSKRICVRGVDI